MGHAAESIVFEEVSQTLSVDLADVDSFLHMLDKALPALFLENYSRGDQSCWPHLFLLCGKRELTYARLELGPQRGYQDRMGMAITQLSLSRKARFYAFCQEYAFSSTIMDKNGLLVQVGEVGPHFPVEHTIHAKTYWVTHVGELLNAGLCVDEFNALTRKHKVSPLKPAIK